MLALAGLLGAAYAWSNREGNSRPEDADANPLLGPDANPESMASAPPPASEGLSIDMGGVVRITVLASQTGLPLSNAVIGAEADLGASAPSQTGTTFGRRVRSDHGGRAAIEDAPVGVPLKLSVSAEGYCAESLVLPGERASAPEHVIRLREALPIALASVRMRVADSNLNTPIGLALRLDGRRLHHFVPNGGTYLMSRDPSAEAEEDLDVRVIGPGCVGSWQRHRVVRGQELVVADDRPPVFELQFECIDQNGDPVSDASLRLAPGNPEDATHPQASQETTSNADGLATCWVVAGRPYWLQAKHATALFHPSPGRPMTWSPGNRPRIRAWTRTKLVVTITNLRSTSAESDKLYLRWKDFTPSSELISLLSLHADDIHSLRDAIRKSLPDELSLGEIRPGREDPSFFVYLPAGAFDLRLETSAAQSAVVAFATPETRTMRVSLELKPTHRVSIRDRNGSGLPGGLLAGHRLTWEERSLIRRALGQGWEVEQALIRTLPVGHGRSSLESMSPKSLEASLLSMAGAPTDIGFIRSDSTVTIRSPTAGGEWTVLDPDGSVYPVSAPPLSDVVEGTIELVVDRSTGQFIVVQFDLDAWSGSSSPPLYLMSVPEFASDGRDVLARLAPGPEGIAKIPVLDGDQFVIWTNDRPVRLTGEVEGLVRREPTSSTSTAAWRVTAVGNGRERITVGRR